MIDGWVGSVITDRPFDLYRGVLADDRSGEEKYALQNQRKFRTGPACAPNFAGRQVMCTRAQAHALLRPRIHNFVTAGNGESFGNMSEIFQLEVSEGRR